MTKDEAIQGTLNKWVRIGNLLDEAFNTMNDSCHACKYARQEFIGGTTVCSKCPLPKEMKICGCEDSSFTDAQYSLEMAIGYAGVVTNQIKQVLEGGDDERNN